MSKMNCCRLLSLLAIRIHVCGLLLCLLTATMGCSDSAPRVVEGSDDEVRALAEKMRAEELASMEERQKRDQN